MWQKKNQNKPLTSCKSLSYQN